MPKGDAQVEGILEPLIVLVRMLISYPGEVTRRSVCGESRPGAVKTPSAPFSFPAECKSRDAWWSVPAESTGRPPTEEYRNRFP
jgi:hypothetical protein